MMTGCPERIALIGFGAIGQTVAASLIQDSGGSELVGVLVRPGHVDQARNALPGDVRIVASLPDLLTLGPTLVVECAGQDAVRSYAAGVLKAGTRLMIISTGALAEPGFLEGLLEAATPPAQLLIPAGAIAGLDGLGALKLAGLNKVTYTSAKPPVAWRGTPAEHILELEALETRIVFFEGSAREAALNYPKNANLAATVALAGLGFEHTIVRLVADPSATGNTGILEAESEIGSMSVVMAGRASSNPKTSASTAYSLLHAIRSRSSVLII
jgi:aspartate dehydrogenase